MKKSGIFISIGRGLAVDEDALASALAANDIGGAAVDVFKKEPLSTESKLWDCENLILTSHNVSIAVNSVDLTSRHSPDFSGYSSHSRGP